MAGTSELSRDLLRTGRAARARGDLDGARAAYAKAFNQARVTRDVEVMGEAALALAADRPTGLHPGRLPAYLFEAYESAHGTLRTQLAIALVRTWAYSGSAERGTEFAAEAIAGAEESGDAALLAEALDAQLLVRWGPDDLDERLKITRRLDDTVAHVADAEARMTAHLWRLTTAVEALDLRTVRRQLRALEQLAAETGSARVRFFSEARRGMYALVVGNLHAAAAHRDAAVRAGTGAGEPDVYAIQRVLSGGIALQSGDIAALRAEAELFDEHAITEGVDVVAAEAAVLWVAAGDLERARRPLLELGAAGLASIPRDGDWVLHVTYLLHAAAAIGMTEIISEGVALLEPYSGRGVPNAGAANFAGVVDGYLAEACAALGRTEEAQRWAQSAADLAEQFGATWWATGYRSGVGTPPASFGASRPAVAVLRPGADGVWTVGWDGSTVAMREVKGLHYLRLLVRQPGLEISALDLSNWVAGHASSGVEDASVGEIIDRQALAAYRARIVAIDADLDEAAQWADAGRIDRLRDERDALLSEIRAATGFRDRVRQLGGTAERARVAVRKAVAAAVDRIADIDPALGRVFADCVRTGAFCRYDPDPSRPLTWVTD